METKNNKKLEALENLENASKNNSVENNDFITQPNIEKENANLVDGYKVLERCDIPNEGVLYPESWSFAYRCPTAKEVANFSTISENDQPAIVTAVEDLIRKCFVIFDTDTNRQISSGQIIDAHRTFFLLLLREFYLPGEPISFESMCTLHKGQIPIYIKSSNLLYNDINENLLRDYDGRKFSLKMPEIEEPIEFLIPTIEITSRIFKHIVYVYRNNQNDKENKDDKIVYDKQFLLIAPYLYIRGNESIKELIQKFKEIQKNDELFKAYLNIALKMKLDNLDYIETICPECGSLEETPIRFPGGWKNMFINKKDSSGYFN